jgi:hypothetical protein
MEVASYMFQTIFFNTCLTKDPELKETFRLLREAYLRRMKDMAYQSMIVSSLFEIHFTLVLLSELIVFHRPQANQISAKVSNITLSRRLGSKHQSPQGKPWILTIHLWRLC